MLFAFCLFQTMLAGGRVGFKHLISSITGLQSSYFALDEMSLIGFTSSLIIS
jgi:hypothetical protein